MNRNLIIIVVLLISALSFYGIIHFNSLITERYAHFQEILITLKAGQEPSPAVRVDFRNQGKMEAYFQLGAYTVCIIVATLSIVFLIRQLRITKNST